MEKIYCPHVLNALEITTLGSFKSCCVSDKLFKDSNGKNFNASNTSIETVWNSQDRKDWIENFDENFPTDCKQCYQVEVSGGESKRLREINYWSRYYNIDTNNVSKVIFDSADMEMLDLKLGNICNLACATCHPASSSRWNTYYKQFKGSFDTTTQIWQDTDEFWNNLINNVKKVKKIEMAGGEPFMNQKQKLLINYLVENDLAKNIDITWISNCTFYEEELIEKFKYFKAVNMTISIDNTHEQFEYMRYPAKWDESYDIFLKFNKLKEQKLINLSISHTISFLNIFRLPEFWKWAKDHKVFVFNNLVMWPFSVQVLPATFKFKVKE